MGKSLKQISQQSNRPERSDSDNVKPFFFCSIAQALIQSDKGKALGSLLGGKKGSSKL